MIDFFIRLTIVLCIFPIVVIFIAILFAIFESCWLGYLDYKLQEEIDAEIKDVRSKNQK